MDLERSRTAVEECYWNVPLNARLLWGHSNLTGTFSECSVWACAPWLLMILLLFIAYNINDSAHTHLCDKCLHQLTSILSFPVYCGHNRVICCVSPTATSSSFLRRATNRARRYITLSNDILKATQQH